LYVVSWLPSLSKLGRCCECSCNENAGATSLLDSLLSGLGEEFGLDDDGDLGEGALAEDLEIALQ
jgi:hypothetical protein